MTGFKKALLGAATFTFLAPTLTATAADLSISCGAVGAELQLCEEGVQRFMEETGHTVTVVSTPNSSTERLALYQQLLAAGTSDIDVFQIDVIWPGILAQHMIDLAPYTNGAEDAHFEAIVENNTVDGKLVAMPWFTDAGLLYYRTDLLEKHGAKAPTTWAELAETAQMIVEAERAEGNDGMQGFVFQGRAYEGLTCNALEWIDSFGGGTIVGDDGAITVNNPEAVEAVSAAASWMGTIVPEGVLNYAEEEARGVFQSGNAVFMRNWPYAWSLANSEDSPINGQVGVAALPKGGAEGQNTGTLGGWQLAVSQYSAEPEAAAELVMFLTSEMEQKRRAIDGAYNPTIAALYEDEDILAANPFFGDLYETFTNAVARPSKTTGERYNEVSNAFYNAVHSVLSGNAEAEPAMANLDRQLKRIARGESF